jgi:hypothetical protein
MIYIMDEQTMKKHTLSLLTLNDELWGDFIVVY